VRIADGEVISQRTAGGGGWGDPMSREPELVARDVRLGYVSREAAAERYGVVIDDRNGSVDPAATAERRTARD
jgi:N-methylhydantoinase B